jgi:surface protein
MKYSILVALSILFLSGIQCEPLDSSSPHFYLDRNGITIKCENCQPGDTGTVNGILYEAVDRDLLEQRRDEEADLTVLCTSLVTDMSGMFRGEYLGMAMWKYNSFNRDIGSWDVSNVTNMYGMFYFANAFNQDLSGWCVEIIANEPLSFADDCPLQNQYYPVWGTCPRN